MSAAASARFDTPALSSQRSAMLRVLSGAGLLVLATTISNAGNYLINLYLGRALGPVAFSEVTLLATFVLVTSIVTTAIGLVISRMVAVRLVTDDQQAVADLRRGAAGAALLFGMALAMPFVLFADVLAGAFQMSSPAPFIILGLSLPLYLLLSVERGVLLGQLRYGRLGASFIVETAVRFAGSIVAVMLGLAVTGVAGAVVISFLGAWVLARAAGAGLPKSRLPSWVTWREMALASGAAAAALLGQAILANADIVFVKSTFSPEVAGMFAAVALVGRAIFFATTSLTMALFPLVAARAERGEGHRRLLALVLLVVLCVCGSMTVVALAAPEFVLSVFFGAAYLGGAALLGPYAVAISLLVAASVIAMYRLSLGQPGSGYLTLIAGVALVIALVLLPETLSDVVVVMLAVNSALLLATVLESGLIPLDRPRRGPHPEVLSPGPSGLPASIPTSRAIVLNTVRGFAMGAADIVPGVSGGTVALILGIYERLIASLRAGSKALGLLLRGDVAGFRTWLAIVDWAFIIPLGVGILTAVVLLAGVLQQLLHDEAELMAAVFLGLVAGSVVVAWRLIRAPRSSHAIIILGVGVATFILLGLQGGTNEESVGQVADPALWTFFIAGAIAVCAMILPGVSGSFLLVVMGMYSAVLSAVTERDLAALAVFVGGAVIGLAVFSQALHYALQRYHDVVLAALIGLMAGSVRVLWPWPDGVDSTALGAPEGNVIVAAATVGIAFVVVLVAAGFAQQLETRDPALVEPLEPEETNMLTASAELADAAS